MNGQQNSNSSIPPANLPNATASLVLGIISIVGAFCYGIVGVICGIIGLVLANKDRKLYQAFPSYILRQVTARPMQAGPVLSSGLSLAAYSCWS